MERNLQGLRQGAKWLELEDQTPVLKERLDSNCSYVQEEEPANGGVGSLRAAQE